MKLALCDDNTQDRSLLVDAIHRFAKSQGLVITLVEYSSGEALLADLSNHHFDAIFLDIYMDEMDGISVARALPSDCHSFLIFTTTSLDFALDAIGLDALHYLVKPVTQDGLAEVYRRYQSRVATAPGPLLDIVVDRHHITMPQSDITFIESDNKASIIHTEDETYRTYETIHELKSRLDPICFTTPQRGYIVNLDYVERYQKTRMVLKNGLALTIGRALRNAVADQYTEYLAGIVRRSNG